MTQSSSSDELASERRIRRLQADFRKYLCDELDQWTAEQRIVRVWWRDDDACMDTPMLRKMLEVARNRDLHPAIAVIPSSLEHSLVEALSEFGCGIWQHGYSHTFYVQGEFGDGRRLDELQRDAIAGQLIMDRAFGAHGWQRVFVPPNHMLSVPFKGVLPTLGYVAVSAGEPSTPVLPHVPEVNAEIDLMDWMRQRPHTVEEIAKCVVRAMSLRRQGTVDASTPLGILTHHRVFDKRTWDVFSALFDVLSSHDAVEITTAATLFDELTTTSAPDPDPRIHANPKGSTHQVTVVLTSCGRPDLLKRTLRSFFRHCDERFFEFLVIEDDARPSTICNSAAFRDLPIKWLHTGARMGQVEAIDMVYHLVRTPYIFHCEDDWEFFRSGFMRKSLDILEGDETILQVCLRALNDTNGHPVLKESYQAKTASYRKLSMCFQSEGWGTWCGLSWNPGLRRRREYLLLGSFKSLAHNLTHAWEVERAASHLYAQHGLAAAILDDECGRGYVRHIGTGRRVGDPA